MIIAGVALFVAAPLGGGFFPRRQRGSSEVDRERLEHERGLAVVLDVVYNHLGPEGNYLAEFGPYFTRRYPNPWGQSLNFDGPDSDAVRVRREMERRFAPEQGAAA